MPSPLGMNYIARNLALESELLRVVELLHPHRVISFKGPLLTRLIYGSLSERVSFDIDVLVEPGDFEDVLNRLEADGYRGQRYVDPKRTLLSKKGSVNLYKGQGAQLRSIDVHLSAFNPHLFSVSPELVQRHVVSQSIHGRSVLTFDVPLAFVHLISHFISHRFEFEMLRDIGHAWDRWHEELEPWLEGDLLAATCTQEAFEYALTASRSLGYCSAPLPRVSTTRAKLVLRGFPVERLSEDASLGYVRGFWSTYLVNPWALPRQAWSGIYLSPQDLAARYQESPSLELMWRRFSGPLREIRERFKRGSAGRSGADDEAVR